MEGWLDGWILIQVLALNQVGWDGIHAMLKPETLNKP
jgi:hypothetical protein